MRRQHHSEKYELSDAEKRDLIKLINEGKPLPEKYRFLLFEDKREVELVWNGKTREVSTARRAERASEARRNGEIKSKARRLDNRDYVRAPFLGAGFGRT